MYIMILRGNKTKLTQNFNENITKLLKTLGKCHMRRIFMTSIQWKPACYNIVSLQGSLKVGLEVYSGQEG